MKELVYFDENGYNNIKDAYEDTATELQELVTLYNKMGLPSLKKEELNSLFFDTEKLIFNKMTNGQPLAIAGLPVSAGRAMEMIAKPKGYDSLIKLANDLGNQIEKRQGSFEGLGDGSKNIAKFYRLDDNGVIVSNEPFINKLAEQYKIYAHTPRAIKMNAFAKDFIAIFEKHEIAKNGRVQDGIGGMMDGIFEWRDGCGLLLQHKEIAHYGE